LTAEGAQEGVFLPMVDTVLKSPPFCVPAKQKIKIEIELFKMNTCMYSGGKKSSTLSYEIPMQNVLNTFVNYSTVSSKSGGNCSHKKYTWKRVLTPLGRPYSVRQNKIKTNV